MLRKLRKNKGFTLVEIMIVVGIITMLAALSMHSLLRAKMTANEAAAIKTLRNIQAGFESYRISNGSYPPDPYEAWAELTGGKPPYLDSAFFTERPPGDARNSRPRQGYIFDIKASDENEYFILAIPENPGVTGGRQFYVNTGDEIIDLQTGTGLGATPN